MTPVPRPPLRLPKPEGDALADRQAGLDKIASTVAACQRCPLGQSRMRTVPGQGNPCSPEILFIGDAPGTEEDSQGLAFVGEAGQLLTKMINAMGFTREQVFITNICKCRPPGNRHPTLDEMQACLPYLHAQLAIIRPKTIVALGASAVNGLLDTQAGMTRLRGQWTRYGDAPLMPTFHPTYLLRFPVTKKDSWGDLKAVLKHLGRQVPAPIPLAAATPT
jgi:DNA polymerase